MKKVSTRAAAKDITFFMRKLYLNCRNQSFSQACVFALPLSASVSVMGCYESGRPSNSSKDAQSQGFKKGKEIVPQ